MSLTIVLKCLSPDAGGDLPSLSQSAISQLEGPDNLENVAFPSKIILDTDVDEEKKSKAVDPTDGYDKSRVTQKEELAAALSLVGSLGYKFFTAYTKKGFVYEILSGTPITAEVVKLVPEDPTDTGPLENSSWLFTLRCAGGEVEESHLISLAMLLDE